jgi:hypothetical protein
MLAANVSAKVPVTMASRTRRRCFRVCCFFNTNSLRVIFRQSRSTRSPGFGPDARFPQMSGIALRLKGPCFCPGTVSAMWRSDQARVLGWPLGFAANGRYSLEVKFFEVSGLESMPIHPSFAWVRAGVCRCGLSRLMRKYGAVAGLGRWHAAGRAEPSADRCGLSGGP